MITLKRKWIFRVNHPKEIEVQTTRVSTGLQFPVEKKRLKREINSALRNGWGYRYQGEKENV